MREDSIFSAAAAILMESEDKLNEDLNAIKKTVKSLKVGDRTNFGVVKSIGDNYIEFHVKDVGPTKISFNQRKLGSRDFVLDKLTPLE